jgi:VWFA-related protein
MGMRNLARPVSACLLTVLSTAMMAQQASPPQSVPKFKVRTDLVTVPVVVLRQGSPLRQLHIRGWLDEHVAGLTKDDFEIEEDGQPKPIASFEEITTSNLPIKHTAPPGVFTNEIVSDGPVTMVVILLDLINTPYFYQQAAKGKLLEYLQRDFRGDQPTMLAVLHPSGLRILHDFTTDPQLLAKLVRRLGGNVERDPKLDNQVETEFSHSIAGEIDIQKEYDAIEKEFLANYSGRDAYAQQLQRNRLETTLLELQQLSHALSAVRGMKTLVWATGGFMLAYRMDFREQRIVDEYVHTLKLLSAAGIAVYPIDTVLETDNPAFTSPQSRYPVPRHGNIQIVQNFMDITQRTGGDYCSLRKDPDLCFQKAVDYSSRYYMLTYYAQSAETARWRKIHVKVRGANLQVRARSGYLSVGVDDDPEQRRKLDIAQAFATPIEYRGLPISVRWTASGEEPITKTAGSAAPSGEPQLQRRHMQSFLLEINPAALTVDAADNNHIKLDFVAVALDPNGKVLADLKQQLDLYPSAPELEGLRRRKLAYSNAVGVPPHTSKVRFIVRDDLNERMGTVSVPIEAQP